MAKTTLAPGEAAFVAAICFGLPILFSLQSVLGGFPDAPFDDRGARDLIVLEAFSAVIAVLFLRTRAFDVVSLLPRPTFRGTLVGVGLFVAVWIVDAVALLPFTASGVAQPIDRMVSESTMSPGMIVVLAAVNGTFEETFILGVLVAGLRHRGPSLAIGAPLLVRLLYHLYQGPAGAVSILVFGAILGIHYYRTGSLWPAITAHVIGDVVPFLDPA